LQVPLFPLGTVLFPGGLLPLRIFEQRYMEMAKACLRDSSPFGVCLITAGAEVGTAAPHAVIGCVARIVQWDMQQLGMLNIVAQGAERFRVVSEEVRPNQLIVGEVELLPEIADAPVDARHGGCVKLLERIAAEHGERLFAKPWRFDSSAWVGARLAEVLPLPASAKQQLLELEDCLKRLDILQRLLKEPA
jgi:Lon protease-like protein